jgi:HK97 family phage major capsid protein
MQEIQNRAEEEDRDWTAEERTNWDAAHTELETVSGDIERLEQSAKLEKVDRSQVITATGTGTGDRETPEAEARAREYREVFWTYVRHGMGELKPEQRQLLQSGFSEVRALGAGSDTAGGYTVPEGFRAILSETMKAYGGLLNLANVITTETGQDLPWPTNDDTGNVGAILAENTQITEQDLTFGQRRLSAYVYTSKLVRVPWALLQDTAFDLEGFLARKLGERIGRAWAAHLVAGTGSSQPEGLVTNATVGKTGAGGQTTTIIYDDLVDLEHSIDPAYRGQNCRYVLHDQTLKVLRKLKDADGRPIFQPIPAPGFPPTINGWPYTVDQGMAVPAASAKTLLFGDIRSGFIVRQVNGIQMVIMRERYADFLQNGHYAFARMDAKPDDPSAVRVYQHPAS